MSSKPVVPPKQWRFGQFELDASTRELRKNGLRLHIQEQPRLILEALLERPGDLVSREELRDRLWPGDTYVDFERSLNAAVAKLRQVLSDSAEQPRYVETVARRGYRFVAPVAPHLVSVPGETGASLTTRTSRQWGWPALALFILFLLSAGAWHFYLRDSVPGQAEAIRFVLPPPEGTRIHPVSAVSPDGRRVAFVVIDSSNRRTLWVRPLASENAIRLEQTDGALSPFFSPDSRDIGFFAEGKLKRISASGGTPRVLCDQSQAAGGTWSRDNVVLFSQAGRLYRVSAAGGAPVELKRPDPAPGESMIDTWPQFLPDGQRYIVRSRTYAENLNPARSAILLGSLDSGNRRILLASISRGAITSSGHLFFLRRGALISQKLDLDRGQLAGEPLVVAEDINMGNESIQVEVKPRMLSAMGPGAFSVSESGILVYHSSPPQPNQLVWFDREGRRLGVVGESREYTQLFVSPDEQWAAVGVRNRERPGILDQTIWLMHLKTHVLSRLSFGGGQDADPVWSPDSTKLVYGGSIDIEARKIDLIEVTLGERAPRLLFSDGHANKPEAWSPDGRLLLFRRNELTVFTLPAVGDRNPAEFLGTPLMRGRFQFSQDGRWLAYVSYESGRAEIYVSRFPDMTGTRQVSTAGGLTPVWRKDGRELFYMAGDGQLLSVAVKAGATLETGPPQPLFKPSIRNLSANMGQFGVTENGRKFLVIEAPPAVIQMRVASDWQAPRR